MSLPEAISSARSLRSALRSAAGPFCAFSVALATVLAVVAATVVPRFLLLPVEGQLLAPAEVEIRLRAAQQELAALEQRRDGHLQPVHDSAYTAMLTQRVQLPSLAAFERALREVQGQVPGGNALAIRSVTFDAPGGRATVRGDIRGLGASGMTTLSSFTDAVGALGMVDAVSLPGVERIDDPREGAVILFTIDCQFASTDDR